jgi:uncharacterized protein YlxW (UPF0749 family)
MSELKTDDLNKMWVFSLNGVMVHHVFREEEVSRSTDIVLQVKALESFGISQAKLNAKIEELRSQLKVTEKSIGEPKKKKKHEEHISSEKPEVKA